MGGAPPHRRRRRRAPPGSHPPLRRRVLVVAVAIATVAAMTTPPAAVAGVAYHAAAAAAARDAAATPSGVHLSLDAGATRCFTDEMPTGRAMTALLRVTAAHGRHGGGRAAAHSHGGDHGVRVAVHTLDGATLYACPLSGGSANTGGGGPFSWTNPPLCRGSHSGVDEEEGLPKKLSQHSCPFVTLVHILRRLCLFCTSS